MHKTIGIFGDSFADPNSLSGDTPWFKFLEKEEEKIECYGSSGSSLWWSFENFLDNYKKYDIIIFVYSCPSRIHSMPKDWGVNHYRKPEGKFSPIFSSLEFPEELCEDQDKKPDFIEAAIEIYWKYFSNKRLDHFIFQKTFDEINKLCKEEKIKIINILSTNENLDLDYSSGPNFKGMFEISKKELQLLHPDANTPVDIGYDSDVRVCHLTQENNAVLANIIGEAIDNYSFDCVYDTVIPLPNDSRFVFNPSITQRYFP